MPASAHFSKASRISHNFLKILLARLRVPVLGHFACDRVKKSLAQEFHMVTDVKGINTNVYSNQHDKNPGLENGSTQPTGFRFRLALRQVSWPLKLPQSSH